MKMASCVSAKAASGRSWRSRSHTFIYLFFAWNGTQGHFAGSPFSMRWGWICQKTEGYFEIRLSLRLFLSLFVFIVVSAFDKTDSLLELSLCLFLLSRWYIVFCMCFWLWYMDWTAFLVDTCTGWNFCIM